MVRCETISKVIIGLLNSVVIIGAIVAGVLLYLHQDKFHWAAFPLAELPGRLILAVAFIALVSAFVGLLAVCCKKFVRTLYIVAVVIAIILEVALVVIAYLFKDTILDNIDSYWNDSSYTKSRMAIEKELEFCGFDGPEKIGTTCGYDDTANTSDNCRDRISAEIEKYHTKIRIGAVVLAIVEVTLVISAVYLRCYKSREEEFGITKF
jgi:Mn2+/Fe2+ NRAMP family transporter